MIVIDEAQCRTDTFSVADEKNVFPFENSTDWLTSDMILRACLLHREEVKAGLCGDGLPTG